MQQLAGPHARSRSVRVAHGRKALGAASVHRKPRLAGFPLAARAGPRAFPRTPAPQCHYRGAPTDSPVAINSSLQASSIAKAGSTRVEGTRWCNSPRLFRVRCEYLMRESSVSVADSIAFDHNLQLPRIDMLHTAYCPVLCRTRADVAQRVLFPVFVGDGRTCRVLSTPTSSPSTTSLRFVKHAWVPTLLCA